MTGSMPRPAISAARPGERTVPKTRSPCSRSRAPRSLAQVAAADDQSAHDSISLGIGQRSRRGLRLGAAGVEVALEHDLGGQLVAERFAFLSRQAGVDQPLLGLDRGVPFVEIDDRPPGDRGQPVAERAGQRGELALPAAGVQRQADDDPLDVVLLDELAVMTRIVHRARAARRPRPGRRSSGPGSLTAAPPAACRNRGRGCESSM